MSLTAGDVLTDGVLLAAPYNREDLVAPGPLLRVINGIELDVARQYALYAPERLSSAAASAPIVLASNAGGYSLSSGIAYGAFVYVRASGDTMPITVVLESRFAGTPRAPAGIVRGGTSTAKFYPADPLYRAWADVTSTQRSWFSDTNESFTYRYVPLPTAPTTLAQVLTSPDEARDYLQLAVAAQILEQAASVMPVPPGRIQSTRQQMGLARQELMRSMVKRLGRTSAAGTARRSPRMGVTSWIVAVV